MTSVEARQLFNAALDDELSAEQRAAFEQALAADPALFREYQALREVVSSAASLQGATPSVDLLGSVQQKLRARSGGRFYRDRFAEQQGRSALLWWAVAASLLLVVAVVVWLSLQAGLLH